MAESEKDRAGKEKIATGMAEAGSGTATGVPADAERLERTVNSTNGRKVSLTAPRFLLAATLLCACGGTQEVRAQAAGRAPPQVQEDVPAQPPGAGSLSDQLDRSKGVITPPAAVSNADPA